MNFSGNRVLERSMLNSINDFFEIEQEKEKENFILLKGVTTGSGAVLQEASKMSAYEMARKQLSDVIQGDDIESSYDELEY